MWTRLLRPGTLQCGSVLTGFARSVWLHAPRTADSDLFWSDLRRQVVEFDGDAGWWPHVFWQELYGRWRQSMVVIAPTIAHQAVLLHRHIRSGQDFQEACAASLTLNWCTGVLLSTQHLEDVMKVVAAGQGLHKGRILIGEQLKGSPPGTAHARGRLASICGDAVAAA